MSGAVTVTTTKKFYESKTFWVNMVGLLVVVLQYTGRINLIDNTTLASALAVVNIFLRFITNTAITL
jgi:hypothetical protein